MSISLDPDRLIEEQRADAKARDDRLAGVKDIMDRYPGPWWDGAPGPGATFDSENASFEYISFAMGQLVWANPRVRVTTRRHRAQAMVAEAIHWATNRWIVDSDYKTVLEDLAVDYCFSWCVSHVAPERRPETYEAEDPLYWPQVSRISQWDFGFDRRAPTWRRARELWHKYRLDKEDLLERARLDRQRPPDQREGWDLAAIRELSTSSHLDIERRRSYKRAFGEIEGPDRGEVELLSFYIPGVRLPNEPGPEDGFNGTIATLGVGVGGAAAFVIPPRPFFGPRWGPYSVSGSYIVPDCPFPLSVLMASAGHIEQATRISQAVDAQVQARKEFILVGAQDRELAATIANAKERHVYFARQIQDLDKLVRQLKMGGTDQHSLAAEDRAIGKRNRAMGMDDVQRGSVTGTGTATEVTLATEAALGRQGHVKGRFQDGRRRELKTIAWYLYHMDDIVFPLGAEAVDALGLDEGDEAWFAGGDYEDGSGTTFDDLQLEIEPYSMERPSETFLRQRGELLSNVLASLPAFAMAQQMGGDVKGLMDAYGDAYGFPQLSRMFPGIDSVDLSAIQPQEAQPRLARDVGIKGLMAGMGQGAVAGGGGSARGPKPQQLAGIGA